MLGASRNHSKILPNADLSGHYGSVITSLLNLVCVFHDSLDVCMVCHVDRRRSGFKAGHGSGRRRLKHELPALLDNCAQKERMDIWYFGIWSLLHMFESITTTFQLYSSANQSNCSLTTQISRTTFYKFVHWHCARCNEIASRCFRVIMFTRSK